MRRSLFIAIAGVAAVLAACKGGKSDAGESFPADFNALPDTARVAYVMKNTTPDSVARFICRAALGQVKGAGIESLGYPEAITRLLGGEQGTVYVSAPKQEEKPRKEFALPSAGREMRRMYAYLLKHRFLDRNVVNDAATLREGG